MLAKVGDIIIDATIERQPSCEVILPMLCVTGSVKDIERCEEELKRESGVGWWAEQKFDGVRATIQNGRIFDRRGKDITKRFPEFEGVEKIRGFMDGEIIGQSGEFSEVAGRMHLKDVAKRKLLARLHPCRFVFWFYGIGGGDDFKWEWAEAMGALPKWLYRAEKGSPKTMWEQAEQEGWEGIILKCKCDYVSGVRSEGWKKVKRWREVIHRFTKLESTPTGVVLEDAEGRRVNVNGAEAKQVVKLMKEKGFVDAEVQYLPQKDSDAWRFPSFRGFAEAKHGEKR